MRRRMVIGGLASALTLLLAGCGGDFPNMTDEQASQVGEYAAITLLRYDASNRSRLVDLPEEAPTGSEIVPPSEEPESEPMPELPAESTTPVIEIGDRSMADSMESFFELPDGVTLAYLGSEVCQSYSGDENDYFSLDAAEGKRLLVLRFALQNTSGAEQAVDFLSRKDTYRITVNGDYSRMALPTILPNDLSSYRNTLASGSLQEVVLLVEVEQTQADAIFSITLNLKNDSKTYTIQVL